MGRGGEGRGGEGTNLSTIPRIRYAGMYRWMCILHAGYRMGSYCCLSILISNFGLLKSQMGC